MQKDDSVRLQHMLDAAQEAISLARDKRRRDLDRDQQLALAPVKCREAALVQ